MAKIIHESMIKADRLDLLKAFVVTNPKVSLHTPKKELEFNEETKEEYDFEEILNEEILNNDKVQSLMIYAIENESLDCYEFIKEVLKQTNKTNKNYLFNLSNKKCETSFLDQFKKEGKQLSENIEHPVEQKKKKIKV